MSAFLLMVVVVGVVIPVVGIISIYNNLIEKRILVHDGFSGVDAQLKRRHNLVSSLVKIIKGYADFKHGVLEDVIRLRTWAVGDWSVHDKQRDENALSGALQNLFSVAKNYPELKADANFLKLQQELSEIEDALQKTCCYYNGTVRDYNTRVEAFPSSLIAGWFELQNEAFFEIENDSEPAVTDVEFTYRKSG